MLTLYSPKPAVDAKAFCKEMSACIGTCRVTDKNGSISMVMGATVGAPMQRLKEAIGKKKGAMTRRSVFKNLPKAVTEHALFIIFFKKH